MVVYGPGNPAGKRAFTNYKKQQAKLKKGLVKNLLAKQAKLNTARLIKKVVNRGLERKTTFFYGGYNDGTNPNRGDGSYANRGWSSQNPKIDTNATDIKQLIPYVRPGTDDWERIGKKINVKSLNVQGAVRVWLPSIIGAAYAPTLYAPANIKVVIYVLQHVSLKDYPNLYAKNDFTQMLNNGIGGTTNFIGEFVNALMPVANQYYRVLKKKIIPLKYAGLWPRPALTNGPSAQVGIPNSHQWFATYNFNLGKMIPQELKFPEETAASQIIDQPTNSSVFMAMGCYNEYEAFDAKPFSDLIFENTYLSKLTFTDA